MLLVTVVKKIPKNSIHTYIHITNMKYESLLLFNVSISKM